MSRPRYPMERTDPLDAAPGLLDLASRGPVNRVRLWDGQEVWLITGWRSARSVLADSRFSADVRRSGFPHVRPGFRGARIAGQAAGAGGATLLRMDPPEHDVLRRMLAGFFSTQRVAAMRPAVESIADGCLDAIAAAGPPAELIAGLALPLPSLVLCEILGIPAADRPRFEKLSAALVAVHASQRQIIQTLRGLVDYLDELVTAEERDPGTGILGSLVRNEVAEGRLSRADLLGTARLLLTAGHETSASMLGLSLATLLRDRAAWDSLRAAPEAVPAAVEELLRLHTIIHTGLCRVAVADVAVGDQVIRAGEGIIVSLEGANRDPEVFADPGKLDLGRGSARHLAFGFGIHQCIGHALARLELEVGITHTMRRFPQMRLAAGDSAEVFNHDRLIYGMERLEATW